MFEAIGKAALHGGLEIITKVFLAIDGIVYGFIVHAYDIFLMISNNQPFSGDVFEGITQRMQIVMGVVMLFIVSYSLLRAIINPDDLTKGDYSVINVLKNILIALVLMALTPTIFNLLYEFQNIILEQNVIGNIIFGVNESEESIPTDYTSVYYKNTESGDDVEKVESIVPTVVDMQSNTKKNVTREYGGKVIAYQTFSAFFFAAEHKGFYASFDDITDGISKAHIVYIPKSEFFPPGSIELTNRNNVKMISLLGCAGGLVLSAATVGLTVPIAMISCGAVGFASGAVAEEYYYNADFVDLDTVQKYALIEGDYSFYAKFSGAVIGGQVTYNMILSTIAGLIVLYLLISYCIDIAIRAVKLGFYQVIAPVPIMLSIIPKQNKMLNNWIKVTMTTFIELFIRVAVINLAVYLIALVPSILSSIWVNSDGFSMTVAIANVFMIIGILLFAKQAPKLISEITGIDSANMKLGGMGAKALTVPSGMVGAGIASAGRGWKRNGLLGAAGGLAGGIGRGAKANWNSKNIGDLKANTNSAIRETTSAAIARANAKERYAEYKAENPGGNRFTYGMENLGNTIMGEGVAGKEEEINFIGRGTDVFKTLTTEAVNEKDSRAGRLTTQLAEMGKTEPNISKFLDRNGNLTEQGRTRYDYATARYQKQVDAVKDELKRAKLTETTTRMLTEGSGSIYDVKLAELETLARSNPNIEEYKDVGEFASKMRDLRNQYHADGASSELKANLESQMADMGVALDAADKKLKTRSGEAQKVVVSQPTPEKSKENK